MTEDRSSAEAQAGKPTDLDLLRLVAEKDETAFAEFFRMYQNRVLNLAYRYLGNRGDAELVTQDTFLRVWQHAAKFRGGSQVWTWLYRITVNLCMNVRSRRRQPTEELDDRMPAGEASQPVEAHARRTQEEIVRKALDSLAADQRMAIVLSKFEGLSYDEIAQTMNKTVSAVATLLFRARENLRARLSNLMPEENR